MNAIDCFVELLAARLTLGQGALPDLAARDAVYRADSLFEAGADLTDVLVGYDAGRVGSSAVREAALRVAALSCQLYLATTGGGLLEELGPWPADACEGEARGEEVEADGYALARPGGAGTDRRDT